MPETETVYTGESLEEALNEGRLDSAGVTIVGMVKSGERKGEIQFTPTDCDSWVDLAISYIEKAEQQGQEVCKDHSHPIFRITLKEPNDPQAKILSALLRSSRVPTQRGSVGRHSAGWSSAGSSERSVPLASARSRFSQTTRPIFRRHAAIGPGGGGRPGGGWFTGGGQNAWGCWDSECCDCIPNGDPCWEDPAGYEHCPCDVVCEPCERCIWPY